MSDVLISTVEYGTGGGRPLTMHLLRARPRTAGSCRAPVTPTTRRSSDSASTISLSFAGHSPTLPRAEAPAARCCPSKTKAKVKPADTAVATP